jgi:hypothetical protein
MPGMSAATGHDRAWWRDPRARWPAIVGLVLVGSGLAHVGVWGVTGGPWEGPVTWRKPILFGISGGLTAVSAGWVWSLLPRRRGDVLLAADTSVWPTAVIRGDVERITIGARCAIYEGAWLEVERGGPASSPD